MERTNCSTLNVPTIVHAVERRLIQEDLVSLECAPLLFLQTNSLVHVVIY